MLSLSDSQGNFIDTINDGPDRLHQALFDGPQDRILLGLKAHANTISHARLVALEETFPLTRKHMGEADFNQISRDYVDTAQSRATDSNRLGERFPAFLRDNCVDAATIELAAIEWAWLESYHAADAVALSATDLAHPDENTLLALPVTLHPSVRIVAITAPLALNELSGLQPSSVAFVRPDAEVRILPLDMLQTALLARVALEVCTLGNLLGLALELAGERAPFEPILHLIGAGALVRS